MKLKITTIKILFDVHLLVVNSDEFKKSFMWRIVSFKTQKMLKYRNTLCKYFVSLEDFE